MNDDYIEIGSAPHKPTQEEIKEYAESRFILYGMSSVRLSKSNSL